MIRVCPECESGKHRNCTRQALDPATDELIACQCLDCTSGGDDV